MDFGISTLCLGTTSVTPALLETLLRAEFTTIELFAALPAFDYRSRPFQRQTARWFIDHELPAPSLHLPFAEDVLAAHPAERQRALDDLKRCLELADLMPLRHVVLHLGTAGQDFSPVYFEYAYGAIMTIQSFSGARVLLETLANQIATFDRIDEFRNAAQFTDLGICYDTGHGELDGHADAVHLDDNSGENDSHLWPFEGDRNWPALIEVMVRTEFQGSLTLESNNTDLGKAVQSRSRLTDLMEEAMDSLEEFRLRHRLRQPAQEEEE